ncbi:MAG: tetratricopeptide repeat protein [bacterium]|jgi:tetratricopeptide (TPR) repeat protein|nr:tetratricopeptide repeat protein [Planctomycetota bacterium]HIL52698.1 tetratricopeptide repeat protein [Planctomycetota bacterium]
MESVPTDATHNAPSRQTPLKVALLCLVVLATYWPCLTGEFVYDDLLIIERNPAITSLANLPQLFGSSYWDFLDPAEASHVGYYRPLTMVLFTVAYALGGGAPLAFHGLSLLVYSLACLAAWRLLTRITESEAVGFGGALLFTLHPLHVESVAWISSLHDALFALLGFLALNEWLKWWHAERDRDTQKGLPWRAGALFLLALLAKDAALALVPIALVLVLGQGLEVKRSVRAWVPFAAAFSIYYLLRVAVFGDALAGFDHTTTDFGVGFGRLMLLRLELLGGAAWLFVWPAELNLFRPFQPNLPAGSASLITGIVGSLAGLALVGWAAWRRGQPALALLLLIPAALAPVLLSVEALGTFPLSDRFLFVPVLGFAGLVAWLIQRFLPKKLALGAIAALCLAYGLKIGAQLPSWQSEEALFRAAIEQNPRNPNVFWGLGRVLLNDYRKTGEVASLHEARASFDSSMDLLEEALKPNSDIYATHDDHLQTNLGLGWALLYEANLDPFHDYKTALAVFERVKEYSPTSERGWIGAGLAWLEMGDPNQASEALRRAIQLNERSPEAHFNMGLLAMRIEEWDLAVKEFTRSSELRNASFEDQIYLARALLEAEQNTEALELAKRTLKRFPDQADPMIVIGIAAAKRSDHAIAISWFDRALSLRDSYAAAHLYRGKSLSALGQMPAAARAFQRSCELDPRQFEAQYNLMVVLLGSEQPESAMPAFLSAYSLRPKGEFDSRLTSAAEELHRKKPHILALLATIDADRGDSALAERWARQALEIDGDHGPSQFILGLLLKQREEFVEAYDLLHSAANQLTDSYQAQMEFAEILLETKQEIAAEPYFRRALGLLPGQIEMQPKLREKARAAIEQALESIVALKASGPPPPPSDQ